jgi:hypothetical protein
MREKFQFEERADLASIVGNNCIIDCRVGAHGGAVLLIVPAKYKEVAFGRKKSAGGIFPFSKAARGYPATFIRVDLNGNIEKTELQAVEVAFPSAQPLPGGRILLVGSRCAYRDGDPEKNAAIFDQDGKILRQFTVGDGINAVQTTSDGRIWVSYFDEGVFGNYGWNEPMGRSGLVCFNLEGRIVWQFTPPEGFGPIDDCYSLNVAQNAVWACYYSDFPVVKIDSQNKVSGWKNDVAGASALAVDENRVLLWGGYGENKTRCVVVKDLASEKLTNRRELTLSLPGNAALLGANVIGRDSILHAFRDNCWYTFDLRQIA